MAANKAANEDQLLGAIEAKRERLQAIIAARSVRSGETVTLASGKQSDFYVDMRATTLDGEGAQLIAELILDAIQGEAIDYIGGLEVGAVPIIAVAAPVAWQQGRTLKAFFVRKKVKTHGRQLRIEGLGDGESLEGKQVLMVEDVTTSGGSVLDACQIVREAGADVALILTIVDRQEGAGEAIVEAGYVFKALFTSQDFR